MAHLLDIPVVLGLSLALKLMLLIERSVSQFARECVNDFSGRGGRAVIEVAGVLTLLVSI